MLLHDVKKIAGLLFSIKSSKQTQRSNEFLGSEEASGEKEEKKKKKSVLFILSFNFSFDFYRKKL